MQTFWYPLTIRLVSWFVFVFSILGRETQIRFDEERAIEPAYPDSIKLIGGDLFTSLRIDSQVPGFVDVIQRLDMKRSELWRLNPKRMVRNGYLQSICPLTERKTNENHGY